MARPSSPGIHTLGPVPLRLPLTEDFPQAERVWGQQTITHSCCSMSEVGQNPLAQSQTLSADGDEMSTAQMIAMNESEMTEDELSNLTYAFQAADMDGGGNIDADEFQTMMTVMGGDLDNDAVSRVISNAKSGFRAWLALADEENIAKAKAVWEECDEDKSGTMDLREVNLVITKLQAMGCNPTPMAAADMADGEIDFDEFKAWFLAQDNLPDDFSAAAGGKPGGFSQKKGKGKLGKLRTKLMSPLAGMTKAVVTGPQQLLKQSAELLKSQATTGKDEVDVTMGLPSDDEAAAREALDAELELIFAEFVFMMRAGLLKEFLPGDWQDRADDMRKLREAFDAADVDGNNELELDELEMVIISMCVAT